MTRGLRTFCLRMRRLALLAISFALVAPCLLKPAPSCAQSLDNLVAAASSATRPSGRAAAPAMQFPIARSTTRPDDPFAVPAEILEKGPLVLHLPGIGGFRYCDRRMLSGLRDGGVNGNLEIYDWTEHDPGIHALQAMERNQKEAQRVADMIVAHHQADPASPIYLTGHSGGCAIATWALEKLPAGVMVNDVLLMAPALSPTYDLSAALRHVRGHLNAFSSTHDILILYTGTRVFGTMDGVQTEAAGYAGFTRPATGDADQYLKLISHPYEPDWMDLDNFGEHVGAMARPFASAILAPLLHAPGLMPATRPAAAQLDKPNNAPSLQ
jgi:hypothetical protein